MFAHLLKLIWKRKTRNLLLSLEIFLAFAIVFAIAAFALRSAQLYRMPLGFDYTDVWSVDILAVGSPESAFNAELYDRFKRGLEALPEVRQVAFSDASPFTNRTSRSSYAMPGASGASGGGSVKANIMEVSDDFFAVNNIKLLEGRAFARSDDGAAALPVVINQRMAHTLFGSGPVIGMQFRANNERKTALKVVGLVEEFRNKGEFMAPVNFILLRYVAQPDAAGPRSILLKLAPGTARSFEMNLSRQLKLIRNDWSYTITPLAALRASQLRNGLMPLMVLAVVAAFLLAMVAFGLFGVLWQATTQRIPEIGLRRAIGASAGHIYRQIIAEQFLLSTGAMLAALVLLVQLPLTGALGEAMNWGVFGAAAALSVSVIYLLSLLCSLYPGWRASRLSPTEALHYE